MKSYFKVIRRNFLILITFLFFSCTENFKQIKIKGSISNPINDKAYFTYSDTSYIALLNKNGSFEITKSYAIFGIPRFLLIDKDGSLISVDAPRSSSSEIRILIDNSGV
ncbi:MAG: TlpA family protein disulfide reductase [Candidatus Neomarinimicrobiota bacterium]